MHPHKKFKAGAISATVWNNETKREGETVTYPTVTLERSYKDKDGKWQATASLRTSDLPKAQLVLNKAYEFLAMRETEA